MRKSSKTGDMEYGLGRLKLSINYHRALGRLGFGRPKDTKARMRKKQFHQTIPRIHHRLLVVQHKHPQGRKSSSRVSRSPHVLDRFLGEDEETRVDAHGLGERGK